MSKHGKWLTIDRLLIIVVLLNRLLLRLVQGRQKPGSDVQEALSGLCHVVLPEPECVDEILGGVYEILIRNLQERQKKIRD